MKKSAILFFVVLSLLLIYVGCAAAVEGHHTAGFTCIAMSFTLVAATASVENYWRSKYHPSKRIY